MRIPRILGLLAVSAFMVTACSTATTGGGQQEQPSDTAGKFGTFIIGRTADTEGQVMAELYGQALRSEGIDVAFTVPSTIPVFIGALQQRGIAMVATPLSSMADALYSVNTGSNASAPRSTSAQGTLDEARTGAQAHGFTLLEPAPGTQVPVYAVTKAFSSANHVTTLSQLSTWADAHPLRFAGPLSCYLSTTCLPRVESVYGLNVHDYLQIDGNGTDLVSALAADHADVGYLASTDLAATDPGIVVLTKDKPLQVFGNVTPSLTTVRVNDEMTTKVNGISALLSTDDLTTMVRSVDAGEADAAQVASYFLQVHDFALPVDQEPIPTVGVTLDTGVRPSAKPEIPTAQAIGIAHGATTQMEIIANLYQGALDIEGIPATMIDTPVTAQDVPAGFAHHEFQLTPTLLGVAAETVNTQTNGPLALPITGTPSETVAQANVSAKQWSYALLDPSKAQDGNAFTVGKAFAKDTGITTLSGLAAYSHTHPLTVAGPPGCSADNDCALFLREKYGVRIGKLITTDWSGPLTREAIDTGTADAGLMLGLDPGIPYFGFTNLVDDRAQAPAANVTPALALSAATPKVVSILNRLSARLDPEEIAELTKLYELMDQSMEYVVRHALEEYGFLQTHTTAELSPDKD